MSDFPVPSAGGSYLRNDETGELTRIDDITPIPADEPAEPEAPPPPETPAEEE